MNKKIENAKALLKKHGYQVDNLWSVDDVKEKFRCNDEQAQNVLYRALTNDATMEQIWLAINIVGDAEGLKLKKNIEYKGINYPVRTFIVSSDDTGDVTYTIADETLRNAIFEDEECLDDEIDESIYFYVEAGVLELSPEEICKSHLDMEFEFIEEL